MGPFPTFPSSSRKTAMSSSRRSSRPSSRGHAPRGRSRRHRSLRDLARLEQQHRRGRGALYTKIFDASPRCCAIRLRRARRARGRRARRAEFSGRRRSSTTPTDPRRRRVVDRRRRGSTLAKALDVLASFVDPRRLDAVARAREVARRRSSRSRSRRATSSCGSCARSCRTTRTPRSRSFPMTSSR